METTTATMAMATYKRMIKSAKEFLCKNVMHGRHKRIQLEFNKEKMTCKAVTCDGYALNVEEYGCISIQEDFVAYVGADVPIGNSEEDYIYIILKELFGDEQFEGEDAYGDFNTIDKLCTVSNPDKRSEITYIQTGYDYFDYKAVLPTYEKPFEIAFQPSLLIKALKAAKSDKECYSVILKFDTAKTENRSENICKPVIITNSNDRICNKEFFKMVLPVHIREKEGEKENGEL